MGEFERLCGTATGPLGVAVSGGGDSLALLMMAAGWARQTGRELIAFTVDHKLRPEAAEEAARVAEICAGQGIPHQTLVWDAPVPKQAAARRARHALMAGALKAAGGDHLLLGHTADDQAETFLMRARQGSTWYGLAGMQPKALSPVWPEGAGVYVARPVLSLPREVLRAELRRRGHGWIEDPSNEDPAYERVRVRRLLRDNPELAGRVLACQAAFRQLRALEDRRIGRWMQDHVTAEAAGGFQLRLDGLPQERAERALSLMIQMAGGRDVPPRRDGVAPLVKRLQSDADFTGATLGGVIIQRRKGAVSLMPEPGIAGPGADSARMTARFNAQIALFLVTP